MPQRGKSVAMISWYEGNTILQLTKGFFKRTRRLVSREEPITRPPVQFSKVSFMAASSLPAMQILVAALGRSGVSWVKWMTRR